MISTDVLMVMAELGDFTNKELEDALEMSSGGVASLLERYAKKRLVERMVVGKFTLNTLTEKAHRVLAQTPGIDPEERCLPLYFPPVIIISDDVTEWIYDCSMCGKPCIGTDENGHCPSCRQVWNG